MRAACIRHEDREIVHAGLSQGILNLRDGEHVGFAPGEAAVAVEHRLVRHGALARPWTLIWLTVIVLLPRKLSSSGRRRSLSFSMARAARAALYAALSRAPERSRGRRFP